MCQKWMVESATKQTHDGFITKVTKITKNTKRLKFPLRISSLFVAFVSFVAKTRLRSSPFASFLL